MWKPVLQKLFGGMNQFLPEFYAMQGEEIVNGGFNGSLPAFIAAFTKRKTLTEKEMDEIRSLIDSAGKE